MASDKDNMDAKGEVLIGPYIEDESVLLDCIQCGSSADQCDCVDEAVAIDDDLNCDDTGESLITFSDAFHCDLRDENGDTNLPERSLKQIINDDSLDDSLDDKLCEFEFNKLDEPCEPDEYKFDDDDLDECFFEDAILDELDYEDASLDELDYEDEIGCIIESSLAPSKFELFNNEAFILTYRHARSSVVFTEHATKDDLPAMERLIDRATEFFEAVSDFKDFQAKWLDDEVRAITAFNTTNSAREIIYISQRLDYRLAHRIGKANTFTVYDIFGAIRGLIIAGPLNFTERKLSEKGLTVANMPMIMVARLSPTVQNKPRNYLEPPMPEAPPTRKTADLGTIGRKISDISSNDPFYIKIDYEKVNDFDYSTYAHTSRRRSFGNEVEPVTKPQFERVWLSGTQFFKSGFFKHMSKSSFNKDLVNDSFLFSDEFFSKFCLLSNRSVELTLSNIHGVEDCFILALQSQDQKFTSGFLFEANPDVRIFLNEKSLTIKTQAADYPDLDANPSLSQLITNGWTVDTSFDIWNPDCHYHEKLDGTKTEMVSHWLWIAVMEQYFSTEKMSSKCLKSNKVYQSSFIKNAKVNVNAIRDRANYFESSTAYITSTKQRNRFGDIKRSYEKVSVSTFNMTNFSFPVGSPLFDIICHDVSGEYAYWSLFVSYPEKGAGLFARDDNKPSYTLLNTNLLQEVVEVHVFDSFDEAMKKIIAEVRSTNRARADNMDVYDVMRVVIDVANMFGCDIDANLRFSSSHEEWTMDKPLFLQRSFSL